MDDYDQFEGSDYFMQKEMFRRISSIYTSNSNEGFATLEIKEEESMLFTTNYISLFIYFFYIFYYFFYINLKIYIKTHFVYEMVIYVFILIKSVNIGLFFNIFSFK